MTAPTVFRQEEHMSDDLQEVSYQGCPGKCYTRKPKPSQVCSHCGISKNEDTEKWGVRPPGVSGMYSEKDGEYFHYCADGKYGYNVNKPENHE